MILTGALVNCAAIVAGGILGTLGSRLMPEKMKETVLAATGLISIGIGVSGAIGSNNQLSPFWRWCSAPCWASCCTSTAA